MTVKLNWDKLTRLTQMLPTAQHRAEFQALFDKLDPLVVFKAVTTQHQVCVITSFGNIMLNPDEISVG